MNISFNVVIFFSPFLYHLCSFVSYMGNPYLSLGHKAFLLNFLLNLLKVFTFHICFFNPCGIYFWIWCEVGNLILSFFFYMGNKLCEHHLLISSFFNPRFVLSPLSYVKFLCMCDFASELLILLKCLSLPAVNSLLPESLS